jgi:hypothetical protein
MCNDLSLLPWKSGQLHIVQNYWEAAGVVAALKAGIGPSSARRPLESATTTLIDGEMNLQSLYGRQINHRSDLGEAKEELVSNWTEHEPRDIGK